jgi:hypothetical protein
MLKKRHPSIQRRMHSAQHSASIGWRARCQPAEEESSWQTSTSFSGLSPSKAVESWLGSSSDLPAPPARRPGEVVYFNSMANFTRATTCSKSACARFPIVLTTAEAGSVTMKVRKADGTRSPADCQS